MAGADWPEKKGRTGGQEETPMGEKGKERPSTTRKTLFWIELLLCRTWVALENLNQKNDMISLIV